MIVGYEQSASARGGIGSLLLAARRGNDWIYVGVVGTGFKEKDAACLRKTLDTLKTKTPVVSLKGKNYVFAKPTLIAEIPSDTAGGLNVSGGLVFSTLLTDSLDIETFRVDAGKAPVSMGETGLPLIFADGKAYYGGRSGGITRNTLNFDSPTTVSGTEGKSIYAVASGPSDLWYATLGCLFRTAK